MRILKGLFNHLPFGLLIPSILSFSFVAALILQYRVSSLGDAGYYVSNGGEILSRANPYDSGFRSGPLGAVFLNLSLGVIPVDLAELFILFSGLIASTVLMRSIFPKYQSAVFTLMPLSTIFASNRELLVNHQINGIILLLISAYWVLMRRPTKTAFISGTFCAAVALDLKPHISIPIFLVLFLVERNFRAIISTTSWIVMSHLLCDLWLGSITEVAWLRNLSDISKDNPWADIANIWPLLSYLPLPDQEIRYFSIFTYLVGLVALVGGAWLTRNIKLILLAFGTPVIGIYCHLYDLGPLILLTLVLCMAKERPLLLYLFLNFAVVFKSFYSIEGLVLLVIANLLFFCYRLSLYNKTIKREIRGLFLGLFVYLTYQISASRSSLTDNDFKSLTICVIVFISLLLTQSKTSRWGHESRAHKSVGSLKNSQKRRL